MASSETTGADGDGIVNAVSAALLSETLGLSGFRVGTAWRDDGSPELHSAAQGLPFFVRFGNATTGNQYADFMFVCALTIEGELSPTIVEEWNRSRRFGRSYRFGQHLMLSLDVSVAGGVTPAFLKSQCLLWDRVLQEFLLHLRQLAPRD